MCCSLPRNRKNCGSAADGAPPRCGAFTLLELLLAVSLLATVMAVTAAAFAVFTSAWSRGQALSASLDHGDFIIEQLVLGLRNARFVADPTAGTAAGKRVSYGFWLEDNGDGPSAADSFSWVKTGGDLVGKRWDGSENPHRVWVGLEENADGESVLTVEAWALEGQPEDEDPRDYASTWFLSPQVTGLDCRVAFEKEETGDEIAWLTGTEWAEENTNNLPTLVELTVYLAPLAGDENPVVVKRLIGIPAAELCVY